MTQASQIIAKQYTEAGLNKKNWGPIAYNVLVEGLAGDGVTDDTAALQALINTAIAANRRTILFPHGTYYVTVLTNDDQVDFVGDNSSFTGGYAGTITDIGALAALKADIELSLTDYPRISPEVDDTARIQRAIDALGGTYDLTSEYVFAPARILRIPRGTYTISSRILIAKNNIKIIGDGMFNTVIKCANTLNIREMVRFRGAYCCELSDLTLDGGLPFNPTGTETYGADIGLVLDQVAFFVSSNLNIMNTRYEGKRCIHLWESYFENLRIHNIGFFGNGGAVNRSAGIRYTDLEKEETFFPGGESNNIVYNKIAFAPVGSYVSMSEVPCYNISFNNIIGEGKTHAVDFPSLGESKWIFSLLSRNIVINGGYTYAHEQAFNHDVTLFDFVNVGMGCKVLNYSVYNENTLVGHYNELKHILKSTSAFPIEVGINIDDLGGLNGYLTDIVSTVADSRCVFSGEIHYNTDAVSRTLDSLFSGTSISRFSGNVILELNGALNTYELSSVGKKFSPIGASQFEEFKCRAWVSFNGTTGTILASGGVSGVVRNSVGNYTVTFETAMPDANYCAVVSANKPNSATEMPEIGGQNASNVNIANRAGATFYDPTIVNVSVFK